MAIKSIKFGKRKIGPGNPTFIIAEIGLNHNQDLNMAKKLIDVAAEAGCSAAKFQTFRAKEVYVPGKLAGTYSLMGKKIPIYDLHVSLEMPEFWVRDLKKHCDSVGIEFFSAPIGKEAVRMLEDSGSPGFKISSYEYTNIPFVRYVSSKKKPIILSTGAANLGEVEEALNTIKENGAPVAIMHCLTKYPASYEIANLAVMETYRNAFEIPVGFSDNGFIDENGKIDILKVPTEAAKAGADLFEIHITLDRKLPGPDHGFATEPRELKLIVKEMNKIRKQYNAGKRFKPNPLIRGSSVRKTYSEESYVRRFAYKCLYARTDISKGMILTEKNVAILRPGEYKRGLEPKFFDIIVNNKARASRKIKAWSPITWRDLFYN